MGTPARRGMGNKPVDVLSQDQCRHDFAYPVDQALPQEPRAVVLKQPAQSPMADRADDHVAKCTVIPFVPQVFLDGTVAPFLRRGGAVDDAGESGVLTGEAQNLPGEQLAVGANLGVYLSLHAVDPVFQSVGCDQDCAEDGDAHGDERDRLLLAEEQGYGTVAQRIPSRADASHRRTRR